MTTRMPKVNVFIASYNRKHLLPLSIDSILNQTYPHYHLYIIDDHSEDGADEVANSYAVKYPNKITVFCKDRNMGLCDSVNRILAIFRENSGEYFAFSSNDDIWFPRKLELQMQCFDNDNELGMVFSEAMIIDNEGKLTGKRFSDLYAHYQGGDVAKQIFIKGNFICGPSVVFSYNALSCLEWKVPDYVGSSTDMYMELMVSLHFNVKYYEHPLLYYRISSDGITSTRRRTNIREMCDIILNSHDNNQLVRKKISPKEARYKLIKCTVFMILDNLKQGKIKDTSSYVNKLLHSLLRLG